jgi:hypothetical protein
MSLPAGARVALIAVLFLFAAFAADVNGKWKADYETPDGQQRTTVFTFKTEGGKLTGTAASAMGEVPILDGKINGDEISFHVVRNFGGNDVKVNYKGKAGASEIKLTISIAEMDRTFDIVAKRQ